LVLLQLDWKLTLPQVKNLLALNLVLKQGFRKVNPWAQWLLRQPVPYPVLL
jgi:hypothetical protein